VKHVIAAVIALAAVSAAPAAAPRTVTAPAPVVALSADGPWIAYAVGRSAHDCNRVFVWHLGRRTVTKLGRKTNCEQTSSGSAIADVAIVGKRVLWLHYAGGNRRRWSLWTATTSRPSPVLLRSVEVDAESPPPILIGEGGSERYFVAYAVRNEVIALREDGSRAFRWTSPSPVTALGAHWLHVAVARADGRVTVLQEGGALLWETTVGTPISAVFTTEFGIIGQRGREVVYDDGERTYAYRAPSGSRLVDGARAHALVVDRGGIVREVDLATQRTVRTFGRGSLARFETAYAVVAADRTVRLTLRGVAARP
jgi:hypothetical protein